MARIPDEELERLKKAVSLVRLVAAKGIALKRHGKDLIGLCPFHDDHHPSLIVSPDTNLWHCPPCKIGGSVIDWVMQTEGVSFIQAFRMLQEQAPSLTAPLNVVKRTTTRKLDTCFTWGANDRVLLQQAIAYYHAQLKQNHRALAYLKQRGIDLAEAIERFKLGFADRSLGYRLPKKNRKDGAALREQLQRIGLLRTSGHEHFWGSLVIPIFDEQGNVTEVYGRKITERLREGTPLHLYLPGPHQGVWNVAALKASKEIILCESLIDALTFWCAGFRNVTASYGTGGFTQDHLEAFKTYGVQRVLIAYDRDEAGEKAATKLAEKLMQEGLDCYRLHFPKGMDANEYACQVQPASKSLGVVIRSAVWLGKGQAPRITSATEEAVIEAITDGDESAQVPPTADHPSQTHDTALAASPVTPPRTDIEAKINDEEVILILGDRRYRVRGLKKNLSFEQMRVNLLVSCESAFHVDTLELYAARQRAVFINQAARELALKEDVIKKDLGKVLLKLEQLQEQHIKETLEPEDNTVSLSEEETQQALALLQAPDLMQRLLDDFDRCGVVGEVTNKLAGYLAAVSRKLDKPLAVMVQSSSAAGKSALMDAVLAMMPDEDKVQYSAMTGQSLFYMEDGNLQHKILAIAEEAGAERASYALKLLQSEGELAIASTGKDPQSGRLVTHEYQVKGPVMIFSTTTAIDPDEELLNRCLILGVDEGREQTQAIHQRQRIEETLDGLFAKEERQAVIALHQNAQRLLKPLAIVNPYAKHLTFLDDQTRTRRDHKKYLTLIKTITLLHQYQRPLQTETRNGKAKDFIEVTLDDIELANHLAHDVLGKSLDELPPQTRRLLLLIDAMVTERCKTLKMDHSDYRFSRKEARAYVGWSDFQVRKHMQRLTEMEYVLVHRGGRGQSFVYELLYDGEGQNGQPFMMGLIDVAKLRQMKNHEYDQNNAPLNNKDEPPTCPQKAGVVPLGSGGKNPGNAINKGVCDEGDENDPENAHPVKKNTDASYRSDSDVVTAKKKRA